MKKLFFITMLITMNAYAEFPDVGKYDLRININNHIFHDFIEITRVIPQDVLNIKIEGFFQVDGLQKEAMEGISHLYYGRMGSITSLTTKVIENGVESQVLLEFIGTDEGEVYVDGNKIGKIESVRELGDANNL